MRSGLHVAVFGVLVVLACSDPMPEEDIRLQDDPAALEARVQREPVRLRLERVGAAGGSKLSVTGSSAELTQVAVVSAPEVNGVPVQATSIHIDGDHAYVGYSRIGAAYGGAVDVFDVSDVARPILLQSVTFTNLDVNDVVTTEGRIFLAVASDQLSFPETAAVRAYDLEAGVIDVTTADTAALSSYVATSVAASGAHVYATSGNAGELVRFAASDLTELASVNVADARSAFVDGTRVAVHAGDRVRLFDAATFADQGATTFARADDEEARAQLVMAGGKAFVTAGSLGVHVVSTHDGSVLQTIPLPDASDLGLLDEWVAANGLGLDGAYLFIAQGGGGLYLSRAAADPGSTDSTTLQPFASLSRVDFGIGNSVNAVDVEGDVLFVASGGGGLRIIEATSASPFVSDAAGFDFDDVVLTSIANGLPGMAWADFDGDGDLDGVVGGTSARYYRNDGGSFVATSLGNQLHAIALSDHTGDGDLDAIFVRSGVVMQMGAGGAASLTLPCCLQNATAALGVVGFPIERSGATDLILFGSNDNLQAWNSPPGTLWAAVGVPWGFSGFTTPSAVSSGNYVALGELNGDGYPEFLYDQAGTGLALFVSGSSAKSWTIDNKGLTGSTGGPSPLAFFDYDDDGDLDLVIGGSGSVGNRLRLFRYDGSSFSDVTSAVGLDPSSSTRALAHGDFDNDGDQDLVFGAATATPNLTLAKNDGSGGFELETLDVGAVGVIAALALVDVDDDGDLEILAVQENGPNILMRNDTDLDQYLHVHVKGLATNGKEDLLAASTPVRLYEADGTTFIARRDVANQQGASLGPVRVHFGGLDPTKTYVVSVAFHTGATNFTVVPQSTSATYGGNSVVPQTLLALEPSGP